MPPPPPLINVFRCYLVSGPAAKVSGLCADAVEASPPIVGIARHAVPPGGYLGIFLL